MTPGGHAFRRPPIPGDSNTALVSPVYCHNQVTFFDKQCVGLQDSAQTLFAHAVMPSQRILIIEDEQDVIDLLTLHICIKLASP